MAKKTTLVTALVLWLALAGLVSAANPGEGVFDFTMQRIDGKPQPLSEYSGQVLLIVNVASKCGNTPQYEGLEALYEKYGEQGFSVLGFPSNDFGGQEPGSNPEIAKFCRATYGVEFPMFAKIPVKGDDAHGLYQYLAAQPEPIGGPVQWNFQKYLVGRDGKVVAKFSPRTAPDDPELVSKLESLLQAKP